MATKTQPQRLNQETTMSIRLDSKTAEAANLKISDNGRWIVWQNDPGVCLGIGDTDDEARKNAIECGVSPNQIDDDDLLVDTIEIYQEIPVMRTNNGNVLSMVAADEFISSGNAEPTSRVLDGSCDHGYAQEWAEPGTIRGCVCQLIYLFRESDCDHEEAEDYPWNDNMVRIILDAAEDWDY